MKTNPANTANNLSILISTLKTIQEAYPTKGLGFQFNQETASGAYQNTVIWDAPDGKLYLWAMPDNNNQITFCPTDTDEIEDAGICTRELTTPEGLTIIIAEDF